MSSQQDEEIERIEPKEAKPAARPAAMPSRGRGGSRTSRQYLKLVMMFIILPTFMVQILMRPCKDFTIGDQKGKTMVITGANSGLGYYTALYLAKSGAKVIMACRTLSKCNEAKDSILKEHPEAVPPDTLALDLSSQASIKSFASALLRKHKGIDVLINNAGIASVVPRAETREGVEMNLGVNHIGHFLLTQLLFKALKKGGVFLGDYESKNGYNSYYAYSLSKAANLLFTYELNDRLQASGNPNGIKAIAVHPGFTETGMTTKSAGDVIVKMVGMNVKDGSQAQLLAASGGAQASNGTFLGPKYMGVFGPPAEAKTGKYDKKAMVELWAVSERLTKTTFKI